MILLQKNWRQWTASAWLAFASMIALGTGLDRVAYQSFLRPMGAEVRFFSLIIPAGALILAVAIAASIAQRRLPRLRMPSWPQFGILILFLGILASFAGARDPWLHGGLALSWLFWLLVIWFTAMSDKHRSALAAGMFVSALINSVIAIVQVLHQGSIGLGMLGETNFSLDIAGTTKVLLGNLTAVRGYGLFPHPNIAFGWIVAGSFAFLLLVRRPGWWKEPPLQLLALVLLLGLLATGSKSIMLVAIITIAVRWYHAARNRKVVWLLAGLVVLTLGALLFIHLLGTDTLTDRLFFLDHGWQLLLQQPLGIGLGHMPAALYALGEASPWMLQPVHMTYSLLTIEAGIIGGLGWLAFCGSMLPLSLKTYTAHPSLWPLTACWIYMLVSGLFDHFWITYPATFLAMAVWAGFLLACHLAKGTGRSYN